jgi:hypothetical protein
MPPLKNDNWMKMQVDESIKWPVNVMVRGWNWKLMICQFDEILNQLNGQLM